MNYELALCFLIDNIILTIVFFFLCLQKTVSAASTTNLRSHLTTTHKNVLIKELRSDSRKTSMDTLLSMRAKSDNELTKDLKALLAERIFPSISGDCFYL